ncbi:MAG: hypothetical protein RLZZ269_1651 [Actinomycetota bacterium]|jgi:endonuclease/exonuclease/phosphatase family metal-dependent hydrolase
MRVMTWNIWWQFGPYAERQPAIGRVLAAESPDVVLLQEVSRDDEQAQRLASELGYHVAVTHDRWPMANAILSRWPLSRIEQVSLPGLDGADGPRRLLTAVAATPWGDWPFGCTHLAHRFDESDVRVAQVDVIADHLRDLRGDPAHDRPVIVGGDFNAVPDSDEIRRLTGRTAVRHRNLVLNDVWEQCGEGAGHTWSGTNPYQADANWPNRRIDYLFVTWPRPKPAGHPRRAWLAGVDAVNGVQPSDHYAVVADFVV